MNGGKACLTAIHLRKSRADLEAEARGEGESLARHRARLLAFAERAGLPIVAEYSEIISGDRLSDRPEMQRLLADVAAGMYDGRADRRGFASHAAAT